MKSFILRMEDQLFDQLSQCAALEKRSVNGYCVETLHKASAELLARHNKALAVNLKPGEDIVIQRRVKGRFAKRNDQP